MLLAALLLGCEALTGGAGSTDPHLPTLEGEPFWTVELVGAAAPPPTWVTGDLPDREGLPTPEHDALFLRVCAGGDPALLERMEARLTAEGEGPWPGPWTGALLDRCTAPGPPLCRWIADRVTALDPDAPIPRGTFELWHLAGSCLDPGFWSWMPRAGGPLFGTVDYLASQDSQWRPVRDPAVPDLVAGLLTERGLHRDRALVALGAVDDPAAAAALLAHRASLPLDEQDEVAPWLYRQSDDAARRVFADLCERRPEAWQCLEGHEPMNRLDDVIAGSNVDLSELLDRFPGYRNAVLDGLERCLDRGVRYDDARGGRCLRVLLGAGEEARAVAALAAVPADERASAWTPRVALWSRFGTGAAITEHLRSQGLVPPAFAPLDPREPPAYLADWLVEGERGLLTAGRAPGDWLAQVLALVPELADDVVVVRSAIADGGRDELLVWQDGVRYRVPARAGTVDERRVTGLLNALAEKRSVDVRFVAIDPGGLVVWGPEAGLRSLLKDGLLVPLARQDPVVDVPIDEDAFVPADEG